MRCHASSILLFLALCVSPGLLCAEESATGEAPAVGMGWGRYLVDTVIWHRTTMKATSPKTGALTNVSERKKTLIRVTDEAYVLKVEEQVKGEWTTREERVPKDYAPDGLHRLIPFAAGIEMEREELGTESVFVHGRAYECEKVRLTIPALPRGKAPVPRKTGVADGFTTTTWEHAEHGLLKMTSTGGWGLDLEVTKLDEPFQLGELTLRCKASTLTKASSGMTTKLLESQEVPGGLVRSEMTIEQGPVRNHTVVELIVFGKRTR